jgi:hypothetical protein
MNPKLYFLPFTTAVTLFLTTAAFAQTPAPALAPAVVPAPVRTPANTTVVTLPFTEDFESGAINTNIWDLRKSGAATATVVQDKVAHGKNALKVHYPAGTTRAWAFLAAKLPEDVHDHLYGRAYVYAANLPVQNHSVFLSAGLVGWPRSNFLEIGDDTGQFKPSFQLNGPVPVAGVARGETTKKQGAIPQDRWFCLEWEFTDKPADRIIIWVDGQQVADQTLTFHDLNSGLVNGFNEFDFGFRSWAQANLVPKDVDVYYDDVAISDKPIGQLTAVAEPSK